MTLQTGADFDGKTYEPELDKVRLTGQLKAVYRVMSDGKWYTLHDIQIRALRNEWISGRVVKYSEAGISARIRDLRKEKFGGFEVQRKRNQGTFYYRLVIGQTDLFYA